MTDANSPTASATRLDLAFYQRPDVLKIARELLGQQLVVQDARGVGRSGRIVETEAYAGSNDAACHAHRNRYTKRTAVMFEPGGVAYVYLCYGIHHLFNIITNTANEPEAILIRAIEPLSGKDHMLHDRNMRQITPALTAGPGRLTQALGITTDDNGTDLTAGRIGIVRDTPIAAEQIRSGKRIGIGYAGPDAELPYRFWIHGHPYVSPAKS